MKYSLDFEKISIEDAVKSIDRVSHPESVKDWSSLRAPSRPEGLQDATMQWMAGLPFEMRPRALAREFPRIANKLCELWKRPAQCEPYLKQLIWDNRGGRKGFPGPVAQELTTIAEYYSTLYPYRHTVWDSVLRNR
jgi:hypothetical protein